MKQTNGLRTIFVYILLLTKKKCLNIVKGKYISYVRECFNDTWQKKCTKILYYFWDIRLEISVDNAFE